MVEGGVNVVAHAREKDNGRKIKRKILSVAVCPQSLPMPK